MPLVFLEEQQFAAPGTKNLSCNGRPCANCGNCSDWCFTGDLATWKWIQTCENWKRGDDDWEHWRRVDVYKQFKRRDGYTCRFFARHSSSSVVSLVLPPAHVPVSPVSADVLAPSVLVNLCLCEDNRINDAKTT
jgi:hypothetical protein